MLSHNLCSCRRDHAAGNAWNTTRCQCHNGAAWRTSCLISSGMDSATNSLHHEDVRNHGHALAASAGLHVQLMYTSIHIKNNDVTRVPAALG